MKKVFILLAAMLVGSSFQFVEAQNPETSSIRCLVLDKTMSMTGHGGTDIWADVQDYCCEWADAAPISSTVLLFTYDKDLYGPQVFPINSESDKRKVKDAIRSIKVDGRNTYISSNLQKAVKYVYENYPSKEINKRIYLITDGIEEEQGSDFAGVLHQYESWRGDYDYLYYVDLRDMATDEQKEVLNDTKGGKIGKGFVQFITAKPIVASVNYTLQQSRTFEQIFDVSDDALFAGMSFDVKVDSVLKVGEENAIEPNVLISPSRGITDQNMEKLEEGKYKVSFRLDFINNSECECDIFVGLTGCTQSDKDLSFEPNDFCVKARNKTKPVVKVKTKNGLED